ncbi:unnamed protein product [Cylicocyclus nassatus]|uniref:Uncharacterized protein n=1 Tax=Cylicocyclus nassatus TaxID=53992 RepID=A0AA36DKN3_CYLNA|nr:unnamed protein product [Cylicocyclus nassatus]
MANYGLSIDEEMREIWEQRDPTFHQEELESLGREQREIVTMDNSVRDSPIIFEEEEELPIVEEDEDSIESRDMIYALFSVNKKRAKRTQSIEVHTINVIPQLSDVLTQNFGRILEKHEQIHRDGARIGTPKLARGTMAIEFNGRKWDVEVKIFKGDIHYGTFALTHLMSARDGYQAQ